jgi:FlaA1/EpsC-like NDP-sugar epimerase
MDALNTTSRAGWISRQLVSINLKRKLAITLAADGLAMPLCLTIALGLTQAQASPMNRSGFLNFLLIMAASIATIAACGLYRAVIRYINKALLVRAGLALGCVFSVLYWSYAVLDMQATLRGALPAYWLLLVCYLLASRLSMQLLLRHFTGMQRRSDSVVAIYGAGETGVKLAMALQGSGTYRAACFLDQKRQYAGRSLSGLPVVTSSDYAHAVTQLNVTTVILAIPAASPQRRREVMRLIGHTKVEIKTVSRLFELDESISLRSIRDIRIEDLLGREQVPPQAHLISKCITGKNVLVTGAGGSIGSELCRQIMTLSPECLHLLDHSEFALYQIQQELASRFPEIRFESHLGSVCDAGLMDRLLRSRRIDTLYHAAAYKHVPMVEHNISEGLRNNVVGARVVAAAAEKWNVATCVLVSTDKAVRPTNIMGASKRIAELIFQAAALHSKGTTYCMVRFGNVLGSSGSVVPLFRRQIESGGAITITHPDVVRYFMLIPEAAQLVVQAGAMAKGGDVFVLNMGEPIRIVDLARTMIDMAGLTEKTADNPDGDIEIAYVGLRPGEKLYEELLIGRNARASEHPRIMRATEYALEWDQLFRQIDELLAACTDDSIGRIKTLVQSIVAEYTPAPETCLEHAPHGVPSLMLARA